jgi:hypothetical protein
MFEISTRSRAIISVIAFFLIVSLSLFFVFNVSTPVSAAVTSDDIRAAYQQGYDDYVGDLEYYKAWVEELQQELKDNQVAADERYNKKVAEYEAKIAILNANIDILIARIDYLQNLIVVELGFDFGYDNVDLAVLNLELASYNAIAARYNGKIADANEVLDGLPDLDYLEVLRQENLAYASYYNSLIVSYVYFIDTRYKAPSAWDYFPSGSTFWVFADFGVTIEVSEYNYAVVQLASYNSSVDSNETAFYSPNGTAMRKLYPSNAGSGSAATDYWGGALNPFKTPTQYDRREKFNFGQTSTAESCSEKANALVSSFIAYYSLVIQTYETHLSLISMYNDSVNAYGMAAESYNSMIILTTAKKAVQDHIISETTSLLDIINVNIENVKAVIELKENENKNELEVQ